MIRRSLCDSATEGISEICAATESTAAQSLAVKAGGGRAGSSGSGRRLKRGRRCGNSEQGNEAQQWRDAGKKGYLSTTVASAILLLLLWQKMLLLLAMLPSWLERHVRASALGACER
jgi:hypothetical protein